MAPIVSLLTILFLLWLINRVATVALVMTGLSMDSASFQVRSALLGIGFTTKESELIVQHSVRRQIFLLLMLAGNTGVVTAMVSLIIGFMGVEGASNVGLRFLVIITGIFVFYLIARSRWIEHRLYLVIRWALARFTHLEVRDYENLMQITAGYGISELRVREGEWLVNRTLQELALRREGVLVLGIYRKGGAYVGAPKGPTEILVGDTLILYGRTDLLADLDVGPPHLRKSKPAEIR